MFFWHEEAIPIIQNAENKYENHFNEELPAIYYLIEVGEEIIKEDAEKLNDLVDNAINKNEKLEIPKHLAGVIF